MIKRTSLMSCFGIHVCCLCLTCIQTQLSGNGTEEQVPTADGMAEQNVTGNEAAVRKAQHEAKHLADERWRCRKTRVTQTVTPDVTPQAVGPSEGVHLNREHTFKSAEHKESCKLMERWPKWAADSRKVKKLEQEKFHQQLQPDWNLSTPQTAVFTPNTIPSKSDLCGFKCIVFILFLDDMKSKPGVMQSDPSGKLSQDFLDDLWNCKVRKEPKAERTEPMIY